MAARTAAKALSTAYLMLKNRKGQGLVEYVLIITFIALVVIIGLTPVGSAVGAKFTEIVGILTGT
ncbi:MAG: Flp family type IVb pilin [Bacillota bacterium]